VVNGDIYTDFPFETLAIDAQYDSHLVLVPNPSYFKGDFGLQHGKALATAAELFTFGSIAVYRNSFFADAQDGVFPIMPLWRRCMAAGRCSAQLYTGPWEDVGTPQRLAALNAKP
jgi:N-acetyl-alpha-D-muramate 1-phosphate uridylyltransferase